MTSAAMQMSVFDFEQSVGTSSKARRYVKHGLVQDLGSFSWLVNPLPTTKLPHTVQLIGSQLSCDCQNYTTRGESCSHISAVHLFEKTKTRGGIL